MPWSLIAVSVAPDRLQPESMTKVPCLSFRVSRRHSLLAIITTLLVGAFPLSAADSDATVRLTIDYGDGVQKVFAGIAWQEGQTVLAALESAAKHPRGIKFEHRGTGATAFVTSIDGQKNEGAGRNWLYEVNGNPANKSCGAWTLEAGDQVLWKFGKRE
jgi:hypothetical protein